MPWSLEFATFLNWIKMFTKFFHILEEKHTSRNSTSFSSIQTECLSCSGFRFSTQWTYKPGTDYGMMQ